MGLDAETLQSSLALIASREPNITRRFYEILFSRYPQVRPLFARNAPERQQRMLQEAIVAVIDHVEDASWLKENLAAMGVKHIEYGVTREMYDWVGESLLATLAEIAGSEWTPKVATAWTEAYGAIVSLMNPQETSANAKPEPARQQLANA